MGRPLEILPPRRASAQADNTTLTYTHALRVSADVGINLRVNTTTGGSNATLLGSVSDLTLNATVADCGKLCPLSGIALALFAKAFAGTVRSALDALLSNGIPLTGGTGAVRTAPPIRFAPTRDSSARVSP